MFSYAMRFCFIVRFVSLHFVAAYAENTQTCDSGQADHSQSKALLQIKSVKNSIVQPVTGDTASLDQPGYAAVAELCCAEEMMAFIKRVIDEKLDLEICHVGGLAGFTLWYDCKDDNQTFANMLEELRKAVTDPCPWLADSAALCKDMPPTCKTYPGATFPPCTTTTTQGPGSTTTTAGPGSTTTTAGPSTTPAQCPTKDIFIAIDASDSIKDGDEWKKQIDFAKELVAKIMGTNNPNGHRINAHWFNEITYPITGFAGSTPPGSNNHDSKWAEANDIGLWVSDGQTVQDALQALVYTDIKEKGTDHPQVFLTADYSFPVSSNSKTVILITDGETHNGNNCKGTPGVLERYQECLGTQGVPPAGVCTHDCRKTNCVCGQHYAETFKKQNYDLVVVGVENGNHNTVYEASMREMASPNRFYSADLSSANFDNLVTALNEDLCA